MKRWLKYDNGDDPINRDVVEACIFFEKQGFISPELFIAVQNQLDVLPVIGSMYDVTREVYRELFLREFEDLL